MATPDWLVARITMPCTIYSRVETGRDEYNSPIYVDSPPIDTVCYLLPVSQAEIQDGRASVDSYILHLLSSMVGLLDGFSRVVVNGVSFEALGPPAYYPSLTQPGVHHVEVIVERSTA